MASERTKDRWVIGLGVVLLVAYIVQARFELVWPWLAHRQAGDTYKILTGAMLAAYLIWQWSLRTRRLADPVGAVRRHKLGGALAPLVLYVHASRFAYGYLLVLALGYLGVTAIGLLHRVALRHRGLFVAWFVIHVATVTMLFALVAYHVAIALAYE